MDMFLFRSWYRIDQQLVRVENIQKWCRSVAEKEHVTQNFKKIITLRLIGPCNGGGGKGGVRVLKIATFEGQQIGERVKDDQ